MAREGKVLVSPEPWEGKVMQVPARVWIVPS